MIENTRLADELRQLRKGSGLQPWKLQHMPLLRKKIALSLGVDPSLLSMSQMYAQLLYELGELGEGSGADALRNAYAIGRETNPRDLTSRRMDFALRLGRHPDTIKAYEDRAVSRLAHRLLNRNTSPTSLRSTENGNEHAAVDALRRTVAEGLSGLYSLGIHSMEVLQILGRNHHPYLNANIDCVLTPSAKGEEWFAYHFSYTFSFTKNIFRVGIVKTLQDSGVLSASGLFDEVACVSDDVFDNEVDTLLADWNFTALQNNGIKQGLEFKEVDAFRSGELLEGLWQVDQSDCRIVEVEIPRDLAGNSSMYCLETTTHLPVGQCAYWEAPGLMYINTITIDVRQFPKHEKRDFHLKPFLGVAYTGALQPIRGKYILPVHSWVTHGHGVMVVWQQKN